MPVHCPKPDYARGDETVAPSRVGRYDHKFWLAFLTLSVIFFSFVRWRLREMPLQRDEGEYAYTAQLLLKGIAPYQLAYTMKLPGTSVAYAVILMLFGQTASGIHLGLLIINVLTAVLVFLVAFRFFEMPAAAMAGISYLVLSTSRAVLGLQGHATHFVVFFAMAGLYVLLHALARRSIWLMLTSGTLFGLAFLMKQHGIFFASFAFLWIFWEQGVKRTPKLNIFFQAILLSLGVAVPFLFTVAVLFWLGSLGKFWFWTFQYAHAYATAQSWQSARHILGIKLFSVTRSLEGLWLLGAIGLLAMMWDRDARRRAPFFLGLLFFSGLAVCPGLVFRGHYFILLLPAVSLLGGLALQSSANFLKHRQVSPTGLITPWLITGSIFLIALSYSLVRERSLLLHTDPTRASREFFGFPEAVQAADLVRLNSTPDARVAVLGSEPEIYFYSDRLSATGYLYTYPLMEIQPYAPIMQREMMKEIEQTHPDFLVLVPVRDSWGRQPRSNDEILRWADAYIERNYHILGTVGQSPTGTAPALLYVLQLGQGPAGSTKLPKLHDLPVLLGTE